MSAESAPSTEESAAEPGAGLRPSGDPVTTVLVGTFNGARDVGVELPGADGLVQTADWPAAPRVRSGLNIGAPSWLVAGCPGTPSEGLLYAAQHLPEGSVAVLRRTADGPEDGGPVPDDGEPAPAPGPGPGPETWSCVQQVPTHGENTCHADLSPSGRWLAAASYDSATLTLFAVLEDGRLGEPVAVRAPPGSGPVTSRQQDPHLHFVHFLDEDRLLVTDLGADRLLEYSVNGLVEGEAGPLRRHPLPAGTGPRHLVELTDGRLVIVGELDSRLHVMRSAPGGDGELREVATVVTHREDADPDQAQESQPSHLVASADESLIYVANRGRNTIGVVRTGDRPELVAEVPCGGDWPRHLELAALPVGPGLLVALERDDAVVHLPLDETGIPGEPTGRVAVRRPGFVLSGA